MNQMDSCVSTAPGDDPTATCPNFHSTDSADHRSLHLWQRQRGILATGVIAYAMYGSEIMTPWEDLGIAIMIGFTAGHV